MLLKYLFFKSTYLCNYLLTLQPKQHTATKFNAEIDMRI